jgi:hypothetical protein
MRNAIITGLPRSGTTLICHLLNKLDNIVALHEPLDVSVLDGADREKVKTIIDRFFVDQRALIQHLGIATSKSQAGHVPSNHLIDAGDRNGRISVIDSRSIKVSNITCSDFSVYIKHPAIFTAMLPILEELYPCYINIRNPLAVLLSWRATSLQVSHGRAPAAEMIDQELKLRLDLANNTLERQFILLDFFYNQYSNQNSSIIVRYEDVVATGGRALCALDLNAQCLNEGLSSQNHLYVEKDPDTRNIAKQLLASPNACWNFYSPNEVAKLANL